jgi:PTS system galactitol-specific IIA component
MDILTLRVENVYSCKEVLAYAAKMLYEMKYVDENYLSALLKREQEFPTGLAIREDFNVAIPHADVKYVLREALVIIKTDKSVLFRKMDEPDKEIPVDIVFLLVIKDPTGYIKFLAKLTELFSNEEFIKLAKYANLVELEKFLKQNLLILR